MDNAGYVAISRQSGLLKEMRIIANNVANAGTAGFKAEGALFAEHIAALDVEGGALAMTDARARRTDFAQGALDRTGASLDFAIEGDGFFLVRTPEGERLTRAGAFMRDAGGTLVTPGGHPVLDPGRAPILVPGDAGVILMASDGQLSADGVPFARLGLFSVAEPPALVREAGLLFRADQPIDAGEGRLLQGFLEKSNVEAVSEIARMLEVSRAYEMGQRFLDREDERIRAAVRALGPQA